MTAAFEIVGPDRPGPWVVTCDHASNHVPPSIGGGDLGLPAVEMARHIAWDIGAEGVARALGEALEAPVVLSRFSRLVIDPNRGEDDPTLLMRLYDGTIIPANRHADAAETARRLEAFHRPYHTALAEVMAARPDPVMLPIHSFTAQLNGRAPRPWQIGVLSAADRRLADPLLQSLTQADFAAWVAEVSGAPLCVGDNAPYAGHLPSDSVDRHALGPGHLNALLELRQDLIVTPDQQAAWAAALAPVLRAALAEAQAA